MRLNAKCIGFRTRADGVSVTVDCKEGAPEVIGSPRSARGGSQAEHRRSRNRKSRDRNGQARSYRRWTISCEPTSPGIWALGDCNGKGGFTHTTYNDYEIVAANLLDDDSRRVSDRITAYSIYIDPPLGRAGLTEAEVAEERTEICSSASAHDQSGPSR